MLHLLALQIAKNTVNIRYFALVSSPNCKKHSKYKLFCTFELSELQKSTVNIAILHSWALRVAKSAVNICYFALLSSPNCKKHYKYNLFCTFELSKLQKAQ